MPRLDREERAIKLVHSMSVKKHVFKPSQRILWTVVGREGDQLVFEDQPYCSCRHFYFRVLSGRDISCIHILALRLAMIESRYDEISIHDDEYPAFLEMLFKDIVSGWGKR